MTVREPTKAVIQNLGTGDRITVPYNPTEYSSTRKLVMCSTSAGVQFQTVTDEEFTVALFFDSYENGTDVRLLTDPIKALQDPTQGSGAKREPPKCLFSWGGFRYTGVLSNFEQKFTLFLPTGVPARCEASLTFTGAPTREQVIENAGLDNCRRFAIVNTSDRLDVLAWRQTGNTARWRDIAAANGINDPLAFPTTSDYGRTLIIPDFHG
jgi:Contractile injection system tube protein